MYKNENLTFQQLLDLDGSVTIHHRNLQRLAIEMYKIKNGLSPIPVQNIFNDYDQTYDLRKKRCWKMPKIRTLIYGTETVRYRGIKTWDILPDDIKFAENLQIFKSKVKTWTPVGCTCELCKTFIPDLGYLE